MMRTISIAAALVALLLAGGCDSKFSLDTLADARGSYVVGDTSYIEIFPPFQGFDGPKDLLIGNDQLMYVADTRNNRIVMMNLAGTIIGQRPILQPMALGQDQRLDLLVSGVVVEASGDSIGAIFRLRLVAAAHDLAAAELDTVWKEPARPRRRFVGIGVLPDNQYLILRTGPDNSSFIDPDTRLLRFNAADEFITPVGDLRTRAGTGITDMNKPTSIGMFRNSRDFVLLQSSEGVAYGAIWMVYTSAPDFEGWLPKFDPALQDQRFIEFVRPNRFIMPTAVVIDGNRKDIFIADAAQDSIFKFDSKGAFRNESFGGFKTGGRLKNPTGMAFTDRTLYVADATANCIFRYRLSTEFQ